MSQSLPRPVTEMMARRDQRMHHYLWHLVRNLWLFFDDDIRQRIRDQGWEPPRPARRPLSGNRAAPIYDNDSGEDFLYMHRQMIAAVNAQLAQIGDATYPRVEGWPRLPAIGDADYPVPPAWETGDAALDAYLRETKSDPFFNDTLLSWERQFSDPEYLRGRSLGDLGARIEFTIHNRMHMRWCEQIAEMRPDVDPVDPEDIDGRWDDPSYDWLGDTYSSHVHRVFWKMHGWVDDRIEDWRRANDVTGPIEWRGTWLGKMPPHPDPHSLHAMLTLQPEEMVTAMAAAADLEHDHGHGQMGEMREVLRAILDSGQTHHLYDPIEAVP